MEDFDAKQAREIAESIEQDEINKVLRKIKSAAEQGKTIIYLNELISNNTAQTLVDKGFKVEKQGSSAMIHTGIYYSITW